MDVNIPWFYSTEQKLYTTFQVASAQGKSEWWKKDDKKKWWDAYHVKALFSIGNHENIRKNKLHSI